MAMTAEQKELVKKHWQEGATATEISMLPELNREYSRNAVIGVIHRMGLTGRDRAHRMRASIRPPRPKVDRPKLEPKPKVEKRPPTPIEKFFRPIEESPGPTGGVKFLEIMPGQCRWPVGGNGLEAFRFCGGTATRGSYCLEHHKLSRGQGTQGEREALKKIPA